MIRQLGPKSETSFLSIGCIPKWFSWVFVLPLTWHFAELMWIYMDSQIYITYHDIDLDLEITLSHDLALDLSNDLLVIAADGTIIFELTLIRLWLWTTFTFPLTMLFTLCRFYSPWFDFDLEIHITLDFDLALDLVHVLLAWFDFDLWHLYNPWTLTLPLILCKFYWPWFDFWPWPLH